MDTVDPRKDTVDQVDRAADQAAKAVDRMKVVAVPVVPDHTKARAEVHPVKEADLAKEAGPEKKVDPRPNVNWHKISPFITFLQHLWLIRALIMIPFPKCETSK